MELFCFLEFGGTTGAVAVLSVMAVLGGDGVESSGVWIAMEVSAFFLQVLCGVSTKRPNVLQLMVTWSPKRLNMFQNGAHIDQTCAKMEPTTAQGTSNGTFAEKGQTNEPEGPPHNKFLRAVLVKNPPTLWSGVLDHSGGRLPRLKHAWMAQTL